MQRPLRLSPYFWDFSFLSTFRTLIHIRYLFIIVETCDMTQVLRGSTRRNVVGIDLCYWSSQTRVFSSLFLMILFLLLFLSFLFRGLTAIRLQGVWGSLRQLFLGLKSQSPFQRLFSKISSQERLRLRKSRMTRAIASEAMIIHVTAIIGRL